ncbi:MAG: sulfite exporter TauE/SafE family protein, partial [Hyphomicrobium sp.]
MDFESLALLCALIFAAALLYTSVGHAGASGYIAAMAIMGLTPAVMKPTALALNILVATLASFRWTRNGRDLAWKALLPLVAGSIPAAFIGGAFQLSDTTYRMLVGLVLLAAGLKFLVQPRTVTQAASDEPIRIPWLAGLVTGVLVGLLSGLTGTGGGIFLTPLLLLLGWSAPRQASGLTAPFILVNSIAALAGNVAAP